MTDPKPKPPLTVGRAYDALAALRSARHQDCDDAVRKVHERYTKKEAAVLARLPEGDSEKVKSLLCDGDTPHDAEFGVDPRDSARLLALRDAIDDHLGWLNLEQEEEADYVARIIGVGVELKKLKPGEPLPTVDPPSRPAVAEDRELPAGVRDYHPGPAALNARKR